MNTQLNNYELMLNESIKHFIASYSSVKHSNGFSAFQSIFYRLIQTMPDPPLEITWFYSAVTSHASKSTLLTNHVSKITLVKDLFQLLIFCSNSSTNVKKIAVLAPVVYELFHLICEFSENGPLRKEVDDLLENIVSYISLCCDKREHVNESDIMVICIEDLVRVWTLDKVEESCKFGDYVRVFFPLLSDEVRKGVSDNCRIEELAGMVLCEVFLLRLGLNFDSGALKEELLNNTRNWAIETIKGFRNYYFLDGLFKMLLEPGLPVANLLSSEDRVYLKKSLFDAVILADYSDILSIQSPEKSLHIALLWSLVSECAVRFARSIYDEPRAVSYENSFSKSMFLNQLITWVINQTKTERPNICSPIDFIKWVLSVEDEGVKVFDDELLRVHAKEVNTIEDEVNEDEEMMDSFDGAVNVGKKRKEGREDIGGGKKKVVKYNCHDSFVEEKSSPFSHGDAVDAGNGRRTQRWF